MTTRAAHPSRADFAGDFECHVTVRCSGDEVTALARWAAVRDVKFTHVVLDRGRVVSQPMLTLRGSGTLAGFRATAEALARRLDAAGFDVVRLKIEAAPWTAGVPSTDGEAVDGYFEHHVKLLLPAGCDTTELASTVVPHAAHLSRNARRERADGRLERFVTQRCRGVGLLTAGKRLDSLLVELRTAGYEIGAIEREFVVLDSDESLDEGWIQDGGHR